MASRVKEDEKNERIIRGLLKLPANRRCINCNSLGPQYVCTNFWTFICTNCSGIHREFTHRVKSISMSKFTSQEVSALQEGGNQRAKEIYFKEWDPQLQLFPDNSDIDRLKEFIKHVYVDRRYTGERGFDRSPRVKGDTEDSYDKRGDSYQGSKSPPYDDADCQCYGEQPRSASSAFDRKRSFGHFDQADERRGNDEPGPVYKSEDPNVVDQQFPDGPKLEGPSHQHPSNPPKVQSVGVANNVPPASIGEPAKSNGLQFPHSSALVQNTASSSTRGSNIGNSVEKKLVSSGNLIDFDADPVPPVTRAVDQSVPQQTASLPAESGGWASFDDSSSLRVSQVASAVSTPESMLSQLSVPRTASAVNASNQSIARVGSFPNQSSAGQWPTIQQHQLSRFPASNLQTSNRPFSAPIVGTPKDQLAPHLHGLTTTLSSQSSHVANKPNHETTAGVLPQPPSTEAKTSGRKELPADLFTMIYPPTSAPFPGYQSSQYLMGYGMHYPTTVFMPTYSHSSSSRIPSALVNERKLVHASTFPSLASLQGALPNVDSNSTVLCTPSLPTQQWFPQQQIPVSAVPRSPYMVQQGARPMPQPPPYFPVMNQAFGGYTTQGAAFDFSGSHHHFDSRNYQPGAPNSFSSRGGNPFA